MGLGGLGLLAAIVFALTAAPGAFASGSPYTWAGASTTTEAWSEPANWQGDSAPTGSLAVSELAFPALTSVACTLEPRLHPCYFSENDISGLSAEALTLDDGNDYVIGGDQLSLGAGGLTARPEASHSAGDFLELPLRLTASQTWKIADRSGGELGENGIFLGSELSGSTSALTVEQSNGSALYLVNDSEVGAMTIAGAEPSGEHIDNGYTDLEEAELNAADGQPVDLRNIYFDGSGHLGALSAENSTISVGGDFEPAGELEADSISLRDKSAVLFELVGTGNMPDVNYSQLLSHGTVELAGAELGLVVHRAGEGEPCPTLARGETFTLISTTGSLTGTFSDAPEAGPETPVDFAKPCAGSQKMRITYDRSGATKTVTATVEAEAKEQEEAAAKRAGEEAAAAKGRQEAEAAARKRQEEEAARTGVLSLRESSPDATIASRFLQASASGAVRIKVSCGAGVSGCVGTVALRTLTAVAADRAVAARSSRARILTLASGSFAIAGGASKTLILHLSSKARELLARLHSMHIRATVVAKDPAGGSHTCHATILLRAPKGKHATK